MTHSSEIIQLITENATSVDERRELEQVSRALSRLEGRVPHRPEFRAQLRDRLKQEARRMRPWYRRPMVWTAGGALAASVAALAVLSFWDDPALPSKTPPAYMAEATPPPQEAPNSGHMTETPQPSPVEPFKPSTQLVQDLRVPRIGLPDEWEGAAIPSGDVATTVSVLVDPALAAPSAPAKLRVYAVTQIPPRAEALAERARRLNFRSEVAGVTGEPMVVTEAERSLTLQPDGKLVYRGPAEGLALPAPDAAGAERVALLWMQEAGLTVPSGEHQVVKEMEMWRVNFRSVMPSGVRATTETISLWVAETGHIVQAEAMTGSLENLGEVATVSFSEAVEQLRTLRLNGVEGHANLTVKAGELIYARVSTGRPGSSVYLQPYWRLTVAVGDATIHRYVPAIASGHLQ